MSETLEPLTPESLSLLSRAEIPEPSADCEGRLFARLQQALGPAAVVTAPGNPPAGVSSLGRLGLPFGAGALVVGMVAGGLLRPVLFPPEVVVTAAPVAMLAPVTPAPQPAAVVEEPPRPAPKRVRRPPAAGVESPKPAAEPPVNPDALLAEERNLLETARSALVRGEPRLAAEALGRHEKKFPAGRLAEERESLWIQSLIRGGDSDGARARAARFREHFPRSLLLPAVDAALASIPK